PAARAEALFWLSSVAVFEGRYETAADDLQRLKKEFRETEHAKSAALLLEQMLEVVTDFRRKEIDSPAAQAYLRHGDFWGREAQRFTIDSSWLPVEDMAADWYDRVIRNFPGSSAAEEA